MTALAYLERPVYGFPEIDVILGLSNGTAQRWIDGYERRGKEYQPVVRQDRTGVEIATWGEFVETRLLSKFRDAGVKMIKMRPIVEDLRQRFGVRYPLATVHPYVDDLKVVYEVQEHNHLEQSMRLVVEAGSNQYILAAPTRAFEQTSEFEWIGDSQIITRVAPLGRNRSVVIDPDRRSGAPVVRATPTEVLAELIRAGEPVEWVANLYELTLEQVLDAYEYERSQAA
jgi:uncharacterized protein (DUF433 family)/transposase